MSKDVKRKVSFREMRGKQTLSGLRFLLEAVRIVILV